MGQPGKAEEGRTLELPLSRILAYCQSEAAREMGRGSDAHFSEGMGKKEATREKTENE